MGDPRRLRKKYTTPMHPWNKENIDTERALKKTYALKNKEELWRMNSILRKFKAQAKKLIALRTVQAQKEREQLMQRLERLGILPAGSKLDDVLALTSKDVLERRLQSFVFRKGLSRSMKQARQFIVHQHLTVAGKKITAPSYIVTKAEEDLIEFSANSPLTHDMHPERVQSESLPEKKDLKKEFEEAKPKEEEKTQSKKEEKAPVKEEKKEQKAETKEETPKVQEKKEEAPKAQEKKEEVKEEPKAENKDQEKTEVKE